MGLFGSLFGGSTAKKQDALGLRFATLEEKYAQHAALKAQVEGLADAGRLRDFENIYASAWASKELMADGRRLYTALLRWIVALDEKIAAKPATFLNSFSAEYEKTPNAFWGALYATALQEIATEVRGGGWAHEVSDKRWAQHGNLHQHAATILNEAAAVDSTAVQNFAWVEAAYQSSLEGGSPEQFNGLWETLYALDTANMATLSSRGIHLLPRWRGRGPEDAEVFARAAIEASRDALGTGAYAAVYMAYPNIGELSIEDTAVDPALLKQSFIDLLQRFPGSVVLLNEFANGMSWSDDEATVWAVYQQGLRAIEPFSWGGDDEAEGMEYAVNAIQYAKDQN